MYFSFALAGHRGTCLRPLHIFALLCFLETNWVLFQGKLTRQLTCGFPYAFSRFPILSQSPRFFSCVWQTAIGSASATKREINVLHIT